MKSILDKIKKVFYSKKQNDGPLKFVLIEIVGDKKAKIRVVTQEHLPKNLRSYYAFELEDAQGNRFPAFLLVKHNLEPIVDIPVVKLFLDENRFIPVDISNIFRYKVEEMKLKMYQAFELVKAGEWGRFAFEKQQNVKTIKWESIIKFAVIAIIGIIIFLVISKMLGLGIFAPDVVVDQVNQTINITQIK